MGKLLYEIPFFDGEMIPVYERDYLIYIHHRDASIAAQVDEIDYEWAKQWNWHSHMSKLRENCCSEKHYARRSTTINGRDVKLYLHKEILKRAGVMPPSDRHFIGDHLNGNSLDCRRANLRWATPKINRENLYGRAWRQMYMFKYCGKGKSK